MRKKLLSFIKPIIVSKLVRNFGYLYMVQIANYIFPLLTLPYLSRVLEPQGFGLLAVGQSVAAYLQIILEYGFNLYGPREVASYRNDNNALSQLVGAIYTAKIFLLLPALAASALALLLPIFHGHADVVFAALFWAIGWGFSPVWVFQGLELMGRVAKLEFFTRLLATVSIFAFVHSPSDLSLPLVFNGLAALLASFIGILWLYRLGIQPALRLASAFPALRSAKDLLAFRVAVSLYTAANPVLLGLVAGPYQVGFYAAAERIVNALHVLTVNPFTSVMLPRISALIREDVGQAAAVLKRVGAFFIFISFLETGMILAFAPLVIQILYGPDYRASVPVLQWLAWLLPGAVLFNALAVQWMLALKLDQVFTRITVATGIVNVLVGLLLATRAGAIGMSGAVVLAQWMAVILSVWVLRARGLFPWRMRGSDAAQ